MRLRNTPFHRARLRYFGDEAGWGFAFSTDSNDRYTLSVFPAGEFFGPPEDAFQVSARVHLPTGLFDVTGGKVSTGQPA